MTLAQYAALGSALFGAAGSVVLFFWSYTLQPFEGGVMGSLEVMAHNDRVRISNRRRLPMQRLGLGLLIISFVIQGAAAFIPPGQ